MRKNTCIPNKVHTRECGGFAAEPVEEKKVLPQ